MTSVPSSRATISASTSFEPLRHVATRFLPRRTTLAVAGTGRVVVLWNTLPMVSPPPRGHPLGAGAPAAIRQLCRLRLYQRPVIRPRVRGAVDSPPIPRTWWDLYAF